MQELVYIILSTFIVSFGAFAGVFSLSFSKGVLERNLLFLVSLSAGAMMGGAFLHLLPEAIEEGLEAETVGIVVLFSFCCFYLIEKLLHWHHCFKKDCERHTFGQINLIGDSVHNFLDGIIVAGAFSVSVELGVVTTFAVALHEIPQEIGDFGVLLYAGYKRSTALILNFLVALTVVLGGVFGYFLSGWIEGISMHLMAFAAGGFLYIAASELMPEIRQEKVLGKSIGYFFVFLGGVLIMYLLKLLG
jgi:zinc and cadmium transporter